MRTLHIFLMPHNETTPLLLQHPLVDMSAPTISQLHRTHTVESQTLSVYKKTCFATRGEKDIQMCDYNFFFCLFMFTRPCIGISLYGIKKTSSGTYYYYSKFLITFFFFYGCVCSVSEILVAVLNQRICAHQTLIKMLVQVGECLLSNLKLSSLSCRVLAAAVSVYTTPTRIPFDDAKITSGNYKTVYEMLLLPYLYSTLY